MLSDILIKIIPNLSAMPNLLEMEADFPESETIAYICDSDNMIYWFTKNDGEMVTSNYPDDTSLADMIQSHFGLFE